MLASPPEAVTQTPVNLIRHEIRARISLFFCEGLYIYVSFALLSTLLVR